MHKEKQNGFTLIEIGVVVVVIAALLAFIVPKLSAVKDAATLEASSRSIQNWAKVAQSTGMSIAQFEPCEEGDGCSFRKYIDGSDCPGQIGGGTHYYDDNGPCVYNLADKSKPTDRGLLDGVPELEDYNNKHNGNPIYLVHDAQTVQAFTCVDLAFVEGTSANFAKIKSGSFYENYCSDAALYHSMPALTANYAKAIARKIAMDGAGAGGDDDDDDDDSECGDGECNGGETADSCYTDCGECGDGLCNGPESKMTCPTDCSSTDGGPTPK